MSITAESSPHICVLHASLEIRTQFSPVGQTPPVCNYIFASRTTSQDEPSNFGFTAFYSLWKGRRTIVRHTETNHTDHLLSLCYASKNYYFTCVLIL